jgi:hypothetical protein
MTGIRASLPRQPERSDKSVVFMGGYFSGRPKWTWRRFSRTFLPEQTGIQHGAAHTGDLIRPWSA